MDAEATALDPGEGSEERVKGTMGDERCLQGLTNDGQDWPPKEESPGAEAGQSSRDQMAAATGRRHSSQHHRVRGFLMQLVWGRRLRTIGVSLSLSFSLSLSLFLSFSLHPPVSTCAHIENKSPALTYYLCRRMQCVRGHIWPLPTLY